MMLLNNLRKDRDEFSQTALHTLFTFKETLKKQKSSTNPKLSDACPSIKILAKIVGLFGSFHISAIWVFP